MPPSCAVTTYQVGEEKSLVVDPLTCVTPSTFTPTPVVVKTAAKVVTFVPNGTVTATDLADSSMRPVAAGLANPKVVRAFADEGVTVTVTV